MDVDGFVVEVEERFEGEVDGVGGSTSLSLAKLNWIMKYIVEGLTGSQSG